MPEQNFVRDGKLDREAAARELAEFLKLVLRSMRLQVSFQIHLQQGGADAEDPDILVKFGGQDQGLLLDRHAELLLSLEHLALRWLHLEHDFHDRIRLDCADYRAAQLAEIKRSARGAADRVRASHQPFHFSPMGARERRIIHVTLRDTPGIRTASEGAGEQRHLVVYPL